MLHIITFFFQSVCLRVFVYMHQGLLLHSLPALTLSLLSNTDLRLRKKIGTESLFLMEVWVIYNRPVNSNSTKIHSDCRMTKKAWLYRNLKQILVKVRTNVWPDNSASTCQWMSAWSEVGGGCRWRMAVAESCRAEAGSWSTEGFWALRTTWQHQPLSFHQRWGVWWQQWQRCGCWGARWGACRRRRAEVRRWCFSPYLLSVPCWLSLGCLGQRDTNKQ